MNPRTQATHFSPFILVLLLLFAAPYDAGCQQGTLETTRLIADKIIRETSFDFNLVPMSFNGGVSGFTLEGIQSTPGETWFAMARIESEDEGAGILGLSFSGHITVHMNGHEIFSGTSDSLVIREYTYDRYRFQRRIGVQWQKGINELLVRCDRADRGTSLLMLPLDDLDSRPVSLNILPVPGTEPESFWILNGPWSPDERIAGQEHQPAFPPEPGYQSSCRHGDRFVPWRLPAVPMVRELVIPGTNSYTRDSYADWHYANGGTMLGILSLYQVTGDDRYLGFVEQYTRQILEQKDYFKWQYETLHALRGSYYRLFRKTMLDDTGGPVLPFAELQRLDPDDASTMPLLREMLDYVVNGQERLPDGILSRPEPEAATVWADDLFMSVPFLLRMAGITGNAALYDEVARQVIGFNRYLRDPATGLYFHGWYNGRNTHTPVRWGRANGWIIWATSEALLYMPPSHPDYKKILGIFRDHMQALAAIQAPSGMWHQVLDHPETFEETSCTAMFTLGMARGVRKGWLEEGYREHALRGWNALQEKIGPHGTVKDICRGTGIGESVEFYQQRSRFDHDPRGLGAMLTAGCEIHLLLDQ